MVFECVSGITSQGDTSRRGNSPRSESARKYLDALVTQGKVPGSLGDIFVSVMTRLTPPRGGSACLEVDEPRFSEVGAFDHEQPPVKAPMLVDRGGIVDVRQPSQLLHEQ